MIITIDGPVASGKTTVVTEIAKKFNLFYIYSGLLFRAVAYGLVHIKHIDLENLDIMQPDDIIQICHNFEFTYKYTVQSGPMLLYKDEDITSQLLAEEIGSFASVIGKNSPIRIFIARWQRMFAKHHSNNIIVDGRDAGTEIFPDADIKLFITASLEERIRRLQKRSNYTLSHTEADTIISYRDNHDSQRIDSPLKIAPDAHVIDTTGLSVDQMIDVVYKHILQKKEISSSKYL